MDDVLPEPLPKLELSVDGSSFEDIIHDLYVEANIRGFQRYYVILEGKARGENTTQALELSYHAET